MSRNFAKFREIKILFRPISYFAKSQKKTFRGHPIHKTKTYKTSGKKSRMVPGYILGTLPERVYDSRISTL